MEHLVLIKTLKELQDLQSKLCQEQFIAFDCETTGLEKDSEIIGISVASDVETGYYVLLSYWDVASQTLIELETKKGIKSFIQFLKTKDLIMHNGTFDCHMVENNYGIRLISSLHTDTLILGSLLNENRSNGLKELGVAIFGEDSRKEQEEMKASVHANGGSLTKNLYELYKADGDLIGRYGAKDAILTMKVFFHFIPELEEQGLYDFFYYEESMPLLKGPTYDLNTTGLKVDPDKLETLKLTLEAECMEAKSYIYKEITPHIKDKYPGTSKLKEFNIGSSKQLSWLLFFQLQNSFYTLTDGGKDVCKYLGLRLPYTIKGQQDFIKDCLANKDKIYQLGTHDSKTSKTSRPKKIGEPWNYIGCGKDTLKRLAGKYKWVEKYLEYAKNKKILNTYVGGIQSRLRYNVIRPGFLQHGTTSGRYSSRNPNFQNLPRDDKRVKECIIARPNHVFIGADYSQLEPRVFASFSGDDRLLNSFKTGDDFYSVIGMEVFDKHDCVPLKDGPANAFGTKYKKLRDIAKVVALSSTYGTTAPKMAMAIDKSREEAQYVIDSYFAKFPSVLKLMLESHAQAKEHGQVTNLFGRPRRMPEAKKIPKMADHVELPYDQRNLLNLAINHRIQSTGASIINRASIAFWKTCQELAEQDPRWTKVKIVLQVHDEIVAEGPEELAEDISLVLKHTMETTVVLPGVDLVAEPKIAKNLADLK